MHIAAETGSKIQIMNSRGGGAERGRGLHRRMDQHGPEEETEERAGDFAPYQVKRT